MTPVQRAALGLGMTFLACLGFLAYPAGWWVLATFSGLILPWLPWLRPTMWQIRHPRQAWWMARRGKKLVEAYEAGETKRHDAAQTRLLIGQSKGSPASRLRERVASDLQETDLLMPPALAVGQSVITELGCEGFVVRVDHIMQHAQVQFLDGVSWRVPIKYLYWQTGRSYWTMKTPVEDGTAGGKPHHPMIEGVTDLGAWSMGSWVRMHVPKNELTVWRMLDGHIGQIVGYTTVKLSSGEHRCYQLDIGNTRIEQVPFKYCTLVN